VERGGGLLGEEVGAGEQLEAFGTVEALFGDVDGKRGHDEGD